MARSDNLDTRPADRPVPTGDFRWPDLPAPYDGALRDAVAFVVDTVDPVGIIATGTIVRGTPNASSDLDLVVIHAAAYRRRIQRFFRGVPAEIFINPPMAIRRYFVDEQRDGRQITAHMIATGQVVFSSDPVVDDLRREASDWLATRPEFGDDRVLRDRYAAASRLEDAIDIGAADPASATMLSSEAVIAMLELDCRVNDGRVPRAKELLGDVTRRDPELGRLAHTFFSATSYAARQAAAESIADRTIGARGFFEWDSGNEPVNPPRTRNTDDQAAIDAVRDSWVAAVATGDAAALADLVTPDYEVWAHGAPAMSGPATVVTAMGAALARYAVTQQFEPIETVVAGNWAFQRGIERMRVEPRDGGPTREMTQRAMLILRRGDDGRWRYARGMTNGLPPEPAR
jgi:uncharacterized protein (TIGR02246 family)